MKALPVCLYKEFVSRLLVKCKDKTGKRNIIVMNKYQSYKIINENNIVNYKITLIEELI